MAGPRNGFRSDAPREARALVRGGRVTERLLLAACFLVLLIAVLMPALAFNAFSRTLFFPQILQLSHLREGTLGSEGPRSVACHVASEHLTCPKPGSSLRASEDPSSLTKNTFNLTLSDEHNCE